MNILGICGIVFAVFMIVFYLVINGYNEVVEEEIYYIEHKDAIDAIYND